MTDKMREEFEAAYVEEMVRRCGEGFRSSALHSLSLKGQEGDYLHVTASQAFWAWTASRAAMALQIPDAHKSDLSGFKDRIKAMIEKVSCQVEPRRFMVVLPKGSNMWSDEDIEIKRSDAVAAIEAAGGSVMP